MISTIIFDFDGVVLESADIKTLAFRKLFQDAYPDKVEEIVDYHKRNMGISRYVKFKYIYENIILENLTKEREDELGRQFSEVVYQEVISAPAVPGILEFLQNYHLIYDLFIASGTPEDELKEIVIQRQLGEYFKGIFGAPRTKEDIIFDIIHTNTLSSRDIVFVGDANSDKQAADATGVNFVARIHRGGNDLESCQYKITDFFTFSGILKQL